MGYKLGRKLPGQGGTAKVRMAEKNGRKYIFKYMKYKDDKPNKQGSRYSKEDKLKLLYNEVKALSKLKHENIVEMIEADNKGILKKNKEEKPILWIVMEFIDYANLRGIIKENKGFSTEVARYYFLQLINVIEYMHSQGFAHDDLKPENMGLTKDYKLKLFDFGFSWPTTKAIKNRWGTEGYKAPELYSKGPITTTCDKPDIFAMGIILFTMLFRIELFYGIKNPQYNMSEYFANPKKYIEERISYRNKDALKKLDDDLVELLTKMLSKDPNMRPKVSELRNFAWCKGPMPTLAEIRSNLVLPKENMEKIINDKKPESPKQQRISHGKQAPGESEEIPVDLPRIYQYEVFF